MRARLALYAAGIQCEVREVLLKDKPPELLDLSAKATVPVLLLPDGRVIDESLDIMRWAFSESDSDHWLLPQDTVDDPMFELIVLNDNKFKFHLDRYKYPERFESCGVATEHFQQAVGFLSLLESRLKHSQFLFDSSVSLADAAIFPFVRQFAAVDSQAFDRLPLKQLQRWLSDWLIHESFQTIMMKRNPWHPGERVAFLF